MAKILVLGGTGFVGRHVCEALQRKGHRITVATRHASHAAAVQHLPLLTVVTADVHDTQALTTLVCGHDAVINLIAILHGNEAAFEKVHVELPARLVQACAASSVQRVVHVSALGAQSDAPSLYLRSKARGEALLANSGLDVTVLRPSVIFGAGDRFLTLFAELQRWVPVLPLACADARFQPVWVDDVARALVYAVEHPSTAGQTVEAVGTDVYTLAQLVHAAGRAAGCERMVLGLPRALAYFQALALQMMPGEPLLSTDNLQSMEVDNVASPAAAGVPTLSDWGLDVASLKAILPTYIQPDAGASGPRGCLVKFRAQGPR
jgi:NADH dehydrogenase